MLSNRKVRPLGLVESATIHMEINGRILAQLSALCNGVITLGDYSVITWVRGVSAGNTVTDTPLGARGE